MSLFTSIAEIKKYISIDGNAKMNTLQPFIDEAEQLYLVDLLGKQFYDEFTALYAASFAPTDTALSAENAALLPYIQRCLAYYMQLQSLLHLSVSVGEMGIRQTRSENSDPAPKWLQEKLQFQAMRNADIHAEKLLQFLEENATDSNDYATWYTSTANTKLSGLIVYSQAIASKHISINNSRRVFLQLRNTIRDIETRMVPKLVGADQYDELKQQIITGSVTLVNEALIDLIEPIVSKRALFMRLPFMRVQINENGVLLYSGTDELIKKDMLASDADIKILRQQLMDGEFGYLADEQELRQFILDNIADYPLIQASTVYTVQPDPGPTWETLNDPSNKHFGV